MTQKLLLSFFAKAASRNQNLALAELPDYVSCFSCEQRWSRGHKAQGQGHKKNPRPRTAVSRTHALEAEDRIARSQGPRTQSQVFSKQKQKKRSSKSFSGHLQFIGVARIFDWGGSNYKSHAMTSSKIFKRGTFCRTKIS